jgi:hypothetical protein
MATNIGSASMQHQSRRSLSRIRLSLGMHPSGSKEEGLSRRCAHGQRCVGNEAPICKRRAFNGALERINATQPRLECRTKQPKLIARVYCTPGRLRASDKILCRPNFMPKRAKKCKKKCHLPGSNKRPHESEVNTSVVRSPN